MTVVFLDEKAQIQSFKNWLKEMKDKRYLLKKILVLPAESRLEKDVSLTPKRIAYEYRYYKAIDKRMEPYLRRSARKVKNRILIRSRRSAMEKQTRDPLRK